MAAERGKSIYIHTYRYECVYIIHLPLCFYFFVAMEKNHSTTDSLSFAQKVFVAQNGYFISIYMMFVYNIFIHSVWTKNCEDCNYYYSLIAVIRYILVLGVDFFFVLF